MSVLRAEIAARIFNTPLLVDMRKAQAALAAIGGRIVEGGVTFAGDFNPIDHVAFENGRPSDSMGKLGNDMDRYFDQVGRAPFDVVSNVGIIPIEGSLVHKGRYIGQSSGVTSYQGIQTQVLQAMKAQAKGLRGVVFEVDSFGGEVAGAFDTADMIAQLSEKMPTLSILTDNAMSAGYLLASCARQIVAPEDGRAGSIGAVTLHADYSKKLENEGIKITIMAAGKFKAQGNPYQAIDEEFVAKRIGELEGIRTRFAERVAKSRGSALTVEKALSTEAAVFGSKEALSLGLIDAVGNGSEALDLFIKQVN